MTATVPGGATEEATTAVVTADGDVADVVVAADMECTVAVVDTVADAVAVGN